VNPGDRPVFGKGVRLRHETDGSAMLLVPEGALTLNGSATAALDLVDGRRTIADIAREIVARFDVAEPTALEQIGALFERLAQRRYVDV